MESTLVPVDEPLIRALQLDAPLRIADVGCGGGGTTLAILRHAPAGSVVHGFDISPKLVELARQRARVEDDRIAFEVADIARAAPAQPYDRLLSRFGVMFFDDPPAGFANLVRWLAPEGRFAFAVWGQPSDNPWLASARDVVARFVEIPRPDPDAPGAFRYADADKLLALLAGAGFAALELRDWRGTLPIGGALSPDDAAQFALAAFSSFSELLATAGAQEARDEARRSLATCYAEHYRDGAVRMDACVHIVTGRRR
ncbi:MAG TPA: class I SAM-dependent methyltransferase [Polyangiaceae bacterium]|nr:class I SAM-dependent methyltransferase [Polyangiaceae bacterium]